MAVQPDGKSQLFVRQSTGLVREASALDATIFNAVFSAPVGATLAWGIFAALSMFPGADLVTATIIAGIINIPVLIMMALLASSMPRTGGDYVWVSRILSPPLALISNFAAALSATIGATYWARYFPVFALGPILVTLGITFDNQDLITWGTNFQTDSTWIFAGAMVMVILMGLILTAGLRMTFAWQNTFWIIASVGTFIAFAVLLIGTNADFVANFNEMNAKFGGGTAQDVINAAGVAGVSPNPGDLNATLPTVFIVMTFMMWNWWSVYLSGELKTASNRGRQLKIMFGALAWDVLFIALGALLLFKVTGYDFMVAVNSGSSAYAIPTGPWYHFMASLVYAAPALTFLIVGSFLFWSLPAMVGNTFMPIRTMFAWSFDRLLPEKLSEVNERTHSPIWAIWVEMAIITAMLIWSINSTDFITWLTLGVLAGVVTVVIVAVAALVFPTRRPDLYQASPANVKFLGIPVLYIVAPLSILCMLFLVWCTVTYPALAMMGNTDNIWWIPAFIGMIVVVGLIVYFGAKFIRRSQGIDIDLVYRELPPE
ncbi:MAG: amino acid permease [Chloroflexi bacterium]|nr:amino acid permease [Chloroflexota bacterium]